MEIPILLSALFLTALAIKAKEKFAAYTLIFSVGFSLTALELPTGISGLAIYFGIAVCALRMPSLRISFFDTVIWFFMTAAALFWLSIGEFTDGYALSYAAVAIVLAIACNIVFDKQNRQTLCASALLSAFAVRLMLKDTLYAADTVLAVVLAVSLTESFKRASGGMTASNPLY